MVAARAKIVRDSNAMVVSSPAFTPASICETVLAVAGVAGHIVMVLGVSKSVTGPFVKPIVVLVLILVLTKTIRVLDGSTDCTIRKSRLCSIGPSGRA